MGSIFDAENITGYEAFLTNHLNLNNMVEWTLHLVPVGTIEFRWSVDLAHKGNLRGAQQNAARVLRGKGVKVRWKREEGTLTPKG